MNISQIFHALLACAVQAAIGLLTGDWWAGAAFGGAFYLGREVAQYEQHRLATYFESRSTMPWYEGFKIAGWSTDAKLDLLVPVAAVCIVAYLVGITQ